MKKVYMGTLLTVLVAILTSGCATGGNGSKNSKNMNPFTIDGAVNWISAGGKAMGLEGTTKKFTNALSPSTPPVKKKPAPKAPAVEEAQPRQIVIKKEVTNSTGESTTTLYVSAAKANVRKTPSVAADVLKTLGKGEAVQVIKKEDEWFMVELAGKEVGWCHRSVLGR